jgi:hypothetical protein
VTISAPKRVLGLNVTIKARAQAENEIIAEQCFASLLARFDMIVRIARFFDQSLSMHTDSPRPMKRRSAVAEQLSVIRDGKEAPKSTVYRSGLKIGDAGGPHPRQCLRHCPLWQTPLCQFTH